MNILLLEDEEIQLNYLGETIEKEYLDVRVYKAKSKHIALDIIKDKEIDIFFLDINLGDGSGIEFAKQIRNIKKYELVPIIFITDHLNYIIEALKDIHCYDYISKPFKKEEIYNIINIFINNKNIKRKNNLYTFINVNSTLSIKIYHSTILFIEYSLRSCIIHTYQGEYKVNGTTLKNILELLDDENIVKSHKAYGININNINKIEKIYNKLWNVHFKDYDKCAQIGYKYRNNILGEL